MGTVFKRGKHWRAQIRRKGSPTLSETFISKAAAQAWVTQTEARLLAGKQGRAIPFTLADAFTRYAAEISPQHKGERWEKARLKLLSRRLGHIRLDEVTSEAFTMYRDDRLQDVSAGTVRREFVLLSGVLRVCRDEWGWMTANPLASVRKPPAPNGRERRVSVDETQAICEALKYTGTVKTQQQRVAAMFLFALETGMRAGEIRTMPPRSGMVVKLDKTKNGDSREVPLSPRAAELADQLSGGHITAQTLDVLFRRARDAAGLPDLTFHDSRHEAITRLAAKLDVMELAKMVGHRDTKMTLRYYHPDAATLAQKLA